MSEGVTAHAPTDVELATFEARVRDRIRAFDLGALLRALERHGYSGSDVMFESNPDESSPERIVERIRFSDTPRRWALVTLNLGLLGSQGLLPSYFRRAIESSNEPELFYDFIRFFDDRLLHNFVRALYPERDTSVYASWDETRTQYMTILGFESPEMLYALFRDVFPELVVRVRRERLRVQTSAASVRTGATRLDGSSVLGGLYPVEPAGLFVDLVCDDGVSDASARWSRVIGRRLEAQVFPLLRGRQLALSIRLTTLAHASWVQVDETASDDAGELGFDRVRSDVPDLHSVRIFEGYV